MVEIRTVPVKGIARTPRGHDVMVLEQRQRTTLVRVMETQKDLEIPASQAVTIISSVELATHH
jgi:hypothetical protein